MCGRGTRPYRKALLYVWEVIQELVLTQQNIEMSGNNVKKSSLHTYAWKQSVHVWKQSTYEHICGNSVQECVRYLSHICGPYVQTDIFSETCSDYKQRTVTHILTEDFDTYSD